MMIEDVRPEGYVCELCLDISPNREDTRTKFGYTMLCAIGNPHLYIHLPSQNFIDI